MHYWSNHICFNMKWIHVVYMNFNVQVLSKFLMLLLWVCSVLRVVPLLKVYTSHTNETVNRPTKNYTNQNVKDKVGLDSVWVGVWVWLRYDWSIWTIDWYGKLADINVKIAQFTLVFLMLWYERMLERVTILVRYLNMYIDVCKKEYELNQDIFHHLKISIWAIELEFGLF